MGKPEFSALAEPTDKELEAIVQQLRKIDRKWRRSRSRNALVEFLTFILQIYDEWARWSDPEKNTRRLQKIAGAKSRRNSHAIRKIVDATSTANRKSKSRWTAALRLVRTERRRLATLKRCLEAYGGISGCAQEWADYQKAKREAPMHFVNVARGSVGRE